MSKDTWTTILGALTAAAGTVAGAPAIFAQAGVAVPHGITVASPYALLAAAITTTIWGVLSKGTSTPPTPPTPPTQGGSTQAGGSK